MIKFKNFLEQIELQEAKLKDLVADAQKYLNGAEAKKMKMVNVLLYKKGNDIVSIVPGKRGEKERNAKEREGWKPYGIVTKNGYHKNF